MAWVEEILLGRPPAACRFIARVLPQIVQFIVRLNVKRDLHRAYMQPVINTFIVNADVNPDETNLRHAVVTYCHICVTARL